MPHLLLYSIRAEKSTFKVYAYHGNCGYGQGRSKLCDAFASPMYGRPMKETNMQEYNEKNESVMEKGMINIPVFREDALKNEVNP